MLGRGTLSGRSGIPEFAAFDEVRLNLAASGTFADVQNSPLLFTVGDISIENGDFR